MIIIGAAFSEPLRAISLNINLIHIKHMILYQAQDYDLILACIASSIVGHDMPILKGTS
jgi:hypothetical protein